MAKPSDDEVAFEKATNRSYLRALENRLARKNVEVSVTANERYADNVPRGERASLGPLYARVGLDAPDEDLGVSFYVGTRYLHRDDWEHRVISWASPAAKALYDPYGTHELNARVLVRRTLTLHEHEVIHADDDWTRTVPQDRSPFAARAPEIPAPPRPASRRATTPSASPPPAAPEAPTRQTIAPPVPSQPKPQPPAPAQTRPATPPQPTTPTRPADLWRWKLQEPLIVDHDEAANEHAVDIVVERAVALATRRSPGTGGLQRVLIVNYDEAYRAEFEQRLRTIARRRNLPTLPQRVAVAMLPTWLASVSGHRALPSDESPDDVADFVPSLVAQALTLCGRQSGWASLRPSQRMKVAYEVMRAGGVSYDPLYLDDSSTRWIDSLPAFDAAVDNPRWAALFTHLQTVIEGGSALKSYDHVIVDQVQEVGALEWEILRAHNPSNAWTLLGTMVDRAEATIGERSWSAVALRLKLTHGAGKADIFVLRGELLRHGTVKVVAPDTTPAPPATVPAPRPPADRDDLEVGMRAVDAVRYALHAPRSETLTPVLSTLQPDQYRLVTQPPTMPLVIQGHPGTGKTIIAVHRAGYLVNEDLAAEQRRPVPKVLLLGPTEQYVRHVMRVVRDLDPNGHITVKSLPSLLADLAGHRPGATTTEGAPEDVDGTVADVADRVVKWCRNLPGWRQLGRAAQIQFAYEAMRVDDPEGNRPPLSAAERAWAGTLPVFTKARAHRHYLPLLAALAMRAGATPARFGHVVVDEAQDVSELEWEIIRAHNPNGRWTVVGDLHQRRRQDVGDLDWHALAKRLHIYAGTELFAPEVVERGYRSTQPILDFANRLLPAGARRPASLQTIGETPKVILAKTATRRDERAIAEAVRLVDAYPGGTAAIITTDPDHLGKLMLADGWRRAGPPVSGTDWVRDSTGHRLAVRTPEAARGVEFDGVVVVEPAFFVRKEEFSGTLYTSLTRANRELVVVHKDPLPAALR